MVTIGYKRKIGKDILTTTRRSRLFFLDSERIEA